MARHTQQNHDLQKLIRNAKMHFKVAFATNCISDEDINKLRSNYERKKPPKQKGVLISSKGIPSTL